MFDDTEYRRIYSETLAHVPMLFLHGEEDRTIRPEFSRDAVRRLSRARDADLEEHYFKDLGHGVVVGRGDEGRTLEFFRRFTRRPMPRQLHFKLDTVRFPRHYWIEALDKDEGIAEVRARIEPDNSIVLKTRRVKRVRLLLRPELFEKEGPIRVLIDGREVYAGPLETSDTVYAESLARTGDPLLAYSAVLEFTIP